MLDPQKEFIIACEPGPEAPDQWAAAILYLIRLAKANPAETEAK